MSIEPTYPAQGKVSFSDAQAYGLADDDFSLASGVLECLFYQAAVDEYSHIALVENGDSMAIQGDGALIGSLPTVSADSILRRLLILVGSPWPSFSKRHDGIVRTVVEGRPIDWRLVYEPGPAGRSLQLKRDPQREDDA